MTDDLVQQDDDSAVRTVAQMVKLPANGNHLGRADNLTDAWYPDGRHATVMPLNEVLDQGLIYLINQAILWPRGLQLALAHTAEGEPLHLAVLQFDDPVIDSEVFDPSTNRRLAALNNADAERYQRFAGRGTIDTPADDDQINHPHQPSRP